MKRLAVLCVETIRQHRHERLVGTPDQYTGVRNETLRTPLAEIQVDRKLPQVITWSGRSFLACFHPCADPARGTYVETSHAEPKDTRR